jgi:YD repeat-containing protein
MRRTPVVLAFAVTLAATLAHATPPPHVVQSRSPHATGGEPIPDMDQLQREWGHARVAEEAARVVAQSPDLITASRALWDARLSEVTFPVAVRGEPATWFEVVSPLQEVDVSEAGLRSLWGAFPSAIVERDRMALTCLDDAGVPVPVELVLGGPEEVLPSDTTILYIVDNIDDCWSAGGVLLLVHGADDDPLAVASDPAGLVGDMTAWGARGRRASSSDGVMILKMLGTAGGEGGEVADLFADGGSVGFDGLFDTLRDCSTAGPCPAGTECPPPWTCSCDEPGSVVTRDHDGDGCPDQRTAFTYDAQGNITSSQHDWQNDGTWDERCRYTGACLPGYANCTQSCAPVKSP